ncbi:hypothetical protein SLA2020_046050 [Shorea laevis]
MGSFPRRRPQNPYLNYRIFASFCSKDALTKPNMSNWIECYNLWTNIWHHVTRIPGVKDNNVQKGFSTVSIGDSLYMIGGKLCHKVFCHDEIGEVDLEVVLSSVLRYDLQNNIWSQCAPLRVPQFDFACMVCDGKIYVAGGQTMSSVGRGVSSAELYDLALDEWRLLPNIYKHLKVQVCWGDVARENPRGN